MKRRPDPGTPLSPPAQTAEHDLPKDRRRRAGEKPGEGADSVRPYLGQHRKARTGPSDR